MTFPSISYVISMGKNISDNQRAKHILPVLEMLSNEIKRFKMKKIRFENLEKKKVLKLDTYRRISHRSVGEVFVHAFQCGIKHNISPAISLNWHN